MVSRSDSRRTATQIPGFLTMEPSPSARSSRLSCKVWPLPMSSVIYLYAPMLSQQMVLFLH